ncbi:MAG: T9SS type A sorting domain-containing protein [Polaribacter sp.]|uniref:T9SS type A sorting domain-containing protein n=1 Tax=Polaribacter sp. TaxID=1920175 RepID=UPI0032672D8F
MKKITYLLFVFFISLSTQAQTWTKLNLPDTGKKINDLYEDINGNLIALTSQGVFKSTDNASNWTLLDRSMEGNRILLTTNNGNIWVTGNGIIKYNGSTSDQQDDANVGNPTIMAETSDGKLFSIVKEGTTIWNTKVYLKSSTDNGTTFTNNSTVSNILVKTNVNAELFVKKNDDIFYLGSDKNLYKSSDKGVTFTAMGAAINYTNKNNGITLDKEKNTFYALWGSNNGKDLYKSSDDGATWTKINSSKLYGADKIVAYNDVVIVHGSLYFSYSSDGGTTFTNKSSLFESGYFPEKVVITSTGKVFATNIKENAIVELDLTNNTQSLKTNGLDYTNAKGISFNGTRISACLDGYAHYTDDYGASWKQLSGEGAFAGNTYVAENGKVYTASSKSGTWNGVYVQNETDDSMIKVIADVNSVWNMRSMFEDDNNNIYCLSNLHGLYKSTDGINFTQMANAPFDNINDMSMWFDEGLKRIYAIISSEVYYSDDYAITWTQGTAPAVFQNVFFKGNGGMWTFANNGTFAETGFYFSTDLTQWTGPKKPNISFDERWDEPVQGNLGVLYRAHKDNAYQGGTVLESTDNGLTWSSYTDGLDTVKGYGFNGGNKGVPYNEILASNNKLFLATVGSIYMANQNKSLSTNKNITNTKVKTYPNPTSDFLNIQIENQQIKSIKIFSSIGKEVMSFSKKNKSLNNINISQLPKGIYMLQLKTPKSFFIKKIIKQ